MRALPTLIVSTLLTCLSSQAAAQRVPIVDAQGAQTNPQSQSAQSSQRSQGSSFGGNVDGDLIYELYSRLDQLQQEMQTLRGTVEEQTYRLQRMEQEQRDRYLDLDQRVSELSTSGAGGAASAASRPGAGGSNLYPPGMVPLNEDIADEVAAQSRVQQGTGFAGATGSADPTSLPSTAENEQQIYRSALNLLLEDGNHEASIRGFQQYIDNYSQGRYFTNALYWQGEALILAGRYPEAESVFSRVVEDYPDDPKAAGALLKIGVSYQQTGQVGLAREAWQSLRNRYPDSLTEIRAAEDYLKRLPSP